MATTQMIYTDQPLRDAIPSLNTHTTVACKVATRLAPPKKKEKLDSSPHEL